MESILVPPLKTQGIKTKLVPWIRENVQLNRDEVWVEPFMGSGVVGFNVAGQRAVFSDTNVHIIDFYRAVQDGRVNPDSVRVYLEREGAELTQFGGEKYYAVRERFNESGDPLDFLFVNRACFNGLMRFNSKGGFNSPWNHLENRFSKGYVTRVCNLVRELQDRMYGRDWTFTCRTFKDAIAAAPDGAFVYCDPPYSGLNCGYLGAWSGIEDDSALHDALFERGARFAVSSWATNGFRENPAIEEICGDCNVLLHDHNYFVGGGILQTNQGRGSADSWQWHLHRRLMKRGLPEERASRSGSPLCFGWRQL